VDSIDVLKNDMLCKCCVRAQGQRRQHISNNTKCHFNTQIVSVNTQNFTTKAKWADVKLLSSRVQNACAEQDNVSSSMTGQTHCTVHYSVIQASTPD